jgi:hypothetical protein
MSLEVLSATQDAAGALPRADVAAVSTPDTRSRHDDDVAAADAELRDVTRRLWVAVVLTAPLVAVGASRSASRSTGTVSGCSCSRSCCGAAPAAAHLVTRFPWPPLDGLLQRTWMRDAQWAVPCSHLVMEAARPTPTLSWAPIPAGWSAIRLQHQRAGPGDRRQSSADDRHNDWSHVRRFRSP